jgi:hypothetical protein
MPSNRGNVLSGEILDTGIESDKGLANEQIEIFTQMGV